MFKHLIITIIAMFLMACGNAPAAQTAPTDNHAVKVVTQVIQVVVDDPDLVDSVDYGIQWWESFGNSELTRVDQCIEAENASCAHVRWALPGELADDVGGLTNGKRTLVLMNHELTMSYLPSYALDVSVSHELGHVLGYQHTKDPTDLMYVNLTPDPKNPRTTICIHGEACRDFS